MLSPLIFNVQVSPDLAGGSLTVQHQGLLFYAQLFFENFLNSGFSRVSRAPRVSPVHFGIGLFQGCLCWPLPLHPSPCILAILPAMIVHTLNLTSVIFDILIAAASTIQKVVSEFLTHITVKRKSVD